MLVELWHRVWRLRYCGVPRPRQFRHAVCLGVRVLSDELRHRVVPVLSAAVLLVQREMSQRRSWSLLLIRQAAVRWKPRCVLCEGRDLLRRFLLRGWYALRGRKLLLRLFERVWLRMLRARFVLRQCGQGVVLQQR